MKRFVIDASVILSWLLPDETEYETQDIKNGFGHSEYWAPSHWKLEVTNALCVSERRGRLMEGGVLEAVQLLSELPVLIDDSSENRYISSTVSLARTHTLSVYDAAYLELAIRIGATLCTLDKDCLLYTSPSPRD